MTSEVRQFESLVRCFDRLYASLPLLRNQAEDVAAQPIGLTTPFEALKTCLTLKCDLSLLE